MEETMQTINIMLPWSPILGTIFAAFGLFIAFRVMMRIVDYLPVF